MILYLYQIGCIYTVEASCPLNRVGAYIEDGLNENAHFCTADNCCNGKNNALLILELIYTETDSHQYELIQGSIIA